MHSLEFFPSFPRILLILGIRPAEEILAFLVGFLAVLPKRQGKEDQGRVVKVHTP